MGLVGTAAPSDVRRQRDPGRVPPRRVGGSVIRSAMLDPIPANSNTMCDDERSVKRPRRSERQAAKSVLTVSEVSLDTGIDGSVNVGSFSIEKLKISKNLKLAPLLSTKPTEVPRLTGGLFLSYWK